MGSYNVACTLTGLTIDCGEECAWVPLEFPRYGGNYDTCAALGNDTLIYTSAMFTPATLPIWGKYYDYGYIEIDDEDLFNHPLHLKLARKMLGMGDEGSIHSIDNNQVVSGAFILKDAYRAIVDNQFSDYNFSKREAGMRGTWTSVYKERDDDFCMFSGEKGKKLRETKRLFSNERELWYRDYGTIFHNTYMKHSAQLEQQLDTQFMLERAMHSCNVCWRPMMNGEQHGNHAASLVLHNARQHILEEKISRMLEDEKEVPSTLYDEPALKNTGVTDRVDLKQTIWAIKDMQASENAE